MDFGGMDMGDQAVLVGCAATMAIAGFIMAIMKYSFSSQEREVSEHLSTLYGSNPLLKTKAEKAAEKKRKAKLAKAAAQLKPVSERPPRAAGDSVHQHVEINPNPEIIHRKESLDDAGKVEAAVKSKARKRKTSKPILHNKDEVPLVKDEEIIVRDQFTQSATPKDEAELILSKQNTTPSATSSQTRPVVKPVEQLSPPEIVEEAVTVTQSSNQQSALPTEQKRSNVTDSPKKTNKKSKQKTTLTSEEPRENPVELVVATISQSGLTESDLQTLINSLVEKHGAESWQKKSLVDVQTERFTKQIQALQVTLDTEREKLMWTDQKLKEMSAKLALTERNHINSAKQAQEMQRRLQQLSEQHRAEVQGIQQARYQEAQRMQQHMQQISEENASLRQALPNTDEVAQMRNQLRALEAELQEQQRRLVKSEANNQELSRQLVSANEGYRQADKMCAELGSRVDELTYKNSRLEGQLTENQSRAHAAENDLRSLQEHLKDKDIEIKALHSEILTAKQATTETISSTSEADNSKIQQLETNNSELQARISNQSKEIDNLQSQLSQIKLDLDKANKIKPQTNGTSPGGSDSEAEKEKISDLEEKIMRLESEIDTLKDKNNELRKKNWTLAESLEAAENTAASVRLLESDLDKKTSHIHELKGLNQTLKEANNELSEKVDQLHSAVSHTDELRDECLQLKQQLVSKDDVIHHLEAALSDEKDKVSATEAECKHLLENELHKSMTKIEDNHRANIDDLQSKLSQSESRIADLATLLIQSESKIRHLGHHMTNQQQKLLNGSSSSAVEGELRHKLSKAQDENQNLRSRLDKLIESSADDLESDKGDNNSPTVSEDQVRTVLKTLHPSVTLDSKANMEQTLTEFYHQTSQQCQNKADQQYKQALLQAESMLDKLSETWQQTLSGKELEISKLQNQLKQSPTPSSAPTHPNVVSNAGASNSNLTSEQVIQLARTGSLQDVSSTV